MQLWQSTPAAVQQEIYRNSLLNYPTCSKSFGNYELIVIQCDAEIQHIEKFSGDTPLPPNYQWKSYGDGGTCFIPPFEYVKEHKLRPDIFIYLTDGYGDAPEKAPNFPVLWVLTNDGEDPALWGKKIKLKGPAQ